MTHTNKRLISFVLALVLVLGMIPGQISAAEVTAADSSVTYTQASISLAGDIGVNYYLTMSSDLMADDGTYMEFTVAGEKQIVPITEAIVTTSNGTKTYRFTCKVAARQMTETVTGQMYTSAGVAVGPAKTYSVKQYCQAAIKAYASYPAYAKLIDLMKAMLNYGAYSQIQLNYKTDDLANTGIDTNALPALTADMLQPYVHGKSGAESGISIGSVSLLLQSTTTIRFYFKLDGTRPITDYTFYVDGEPVEPVLHSGNQYYVDKINVSAKDLDVPSVVNVGGLQVWYCGLSYVRQIAIQNADKSPEALLNVVRSLYAYSMAANAYFGCVVTFVDYDGTVLKTDIVEKGAAATAPADPVREGYVFTGWDKSFSNVTGDMTVTATYEPVSTTAYTVTFVDHNGAVLSAVQVREGADAALPAAPGKTGATFLGWSGNYCNVMHDETVRAVYSDEKNVFIVHSASGSVGDTVTVLVDVDGAVKICGFDFALFYDEALELVAYDEDLDLDILANADRYENGIKLNFSATSDKTKQRDIIELTFKIKESPRKSLPITIEMDSIKEIVNDNPVNTTHVIVNGVVTVK